LSIMAFLGRATRDTGERPQWGPPASWGKEQAFSLHRKAPFGIAFDDDIAAIVQQCDGARVSCGPTPRSQRTSRTRTSRSPRSPLKLGSLCSDLQTRPNTQAWWTGGHLASVVAAVTPKESKGPSAGWLGKSHRSQSIHASCHRPGSWMALPPALSARRSELVTERRRVWKCGPFDESPEPPALSRSVARRQDLNGEKAHAQPVVARCKNSTHDGVAQAAETSASIPRSENFEGEMSEQGARLKPTGTLSAGQRTGCPGIGFSNSSCNSSQSTKSWPILESSIACCMDQAAIHDCEASYVAESPSATDCEAPSASVVSAAEEHAGSDTSLLAELQEPLPPAKRHRRKIRRHELLRLLVRGRRRQTLDLRFYFVEWKRSWRQCKRHVFVLHSADEGCAVGQQLPNSMDANCDCSCTLSSSWNGASASETDDPLAWSDA